MTPAISTTSQNASPLDGTLFGRTKDRDIRSNFASVLGRMGKATGETDEQLVRRSAQNFVSLTLVQPLLKSLRSSGNAAPPFAPTEGEKQFQGLMDAETAQRIVSAAHFPLVDRITHDMLAKSRKDAGSTDAPGASPLSDAADSGEQA